MSHLFFCLVGKRERAGMQYSNPAPRIFCCSCWDKKLQPPVQQLHFILIRDENVFIAAFSLWEGIYLGKKRVINSWYPCLTHKHILPYILCVFFTRGFGTQLVQMAFYVAFSKYPRLVFLIELCVFQSCHLCKHWNWLFKFFFFHTRHQRKYSNFSLPFVFLSLLTTSQQSRLVPLMLYFHSQSSLTAQHLTGKDVTCTQNPAFSAFFPSPTHQTERHRIGQM